MNTIIAQTSYATSAFEKEIRRHTSTEKKKPYVAPFEEVLRQQLYDVHDVEESGEITGLWPVGQRTEGHNRGMESQKRRKKGVPCLEHITLSDPCLGNYVDAFA
jgi:hypothetical protein